MRRIGVMGLAFAAWAAGVSAEAMSLGIRTALWGAAPARRQSGVARLADAVGASGLEFGTGGDVGWFVQSDVAHEGATALRSGAISDAQESWVTATVTGAGTVSFWWKSSSEVYKNTPIDYVSFSVDGGEWARLGGETSWTNLSFAVVGAGHHVLRWAYSKDLSDSSGEDCAWLDSVTWTPSDPLPVLNVAATDSDVASIIAGMSDVRLSEKVVGPAAYTAFRNWVDGKGLSHGAVRDAPNAWLSYALDAPGLMAKTTLVTSEEVSIVSIEASGDTAGTFNLVVDIAGVEIGTAAQLAEVFGVEGATELNGSAFSSDCLTFSLQRTADGKTKVTVTPDGTPQSFFLRVKVK